MISHIHSHYIIFLIIIIITITQKGVTDIYNIRPDSCDMAASACVSTTCWRKPLVQSTSTCLPAQALVWLAGIPGGRTIADVRRWIPRKGDAAIICVYVCAKCRRARQGKLNPIVLECHVGGETVNWRVIYSDVGEERCFTGQCTASRGCCCFFFSPGECEGGRRKEEREMNAVMSAQPTPV